MDGPHNATVVPAVVVFFFGAPLYYANAGFFRLKVHGALAAASPPARLLVLDAVAMSDIDYTGARALAQVLDELGRTHVTVAVARAIAGAPKNFARSGLLDRIGRDHFFPSVDEAVLALGPDAAASAPTMPPP